MAVVSPIAYVLVLFAMREAPLSRGARARGLHAVCRPDRRHLFGEGDRVARLCGAVCIALGVTAWPWGEHAEPSATVAGR